MESQLKVSAVLAEQLHRLEQRLLAEVKKDKNFYRLQNVPGIGPKKAAKTQAIVARKTVAHKLARPSYFILRDFLLFLGLEIFISFVTELSEIGKGDYGITSAFLYVLRACGISIFTMSTIVLRVALECDSFLEASFSFLGEKWLGKTIKAH